MIKKENLPLDRSRGSSGHPSNPPKKAESQRIVNVEPDDGARFQVLVSVNDVENAGHRPELAGVVSKTEAGWLRGYNSLGLGREFYGDDDRASLAPAAPDPSREAWKAARTPTGMWDLMLWAFNDEKVRFSCGSDIAAKSTHSSMANAIAAGLSGIVLGAEGGGGYQPPACHGDALEVYLAVSEVLASAGAPPGASTELARPHFTVADFESGAWRRVDRLPGADKTEGGRTRAFRLLIKQTEVAKAPPNWNPDVSLPKRFFAKTRPNGKHVHEIGVKKHGHYNGKPVSTILLAEGYTHEEAESIRTAAREQYAEWLVLLGAVRDEIHTRGDALTRWRITGLGVPETPWNSPAPDVA